LRRSFGPTLCDLFFDPFHTLYTAELADRIAPQDAYKSPVDLEQVRRGAEQETAAAGYNATFLYPAGGLDHLARELQRKTRVEFGREVVSIDPAARRLVLRDGSTSTYERLISTLPLNRMMTLTGLSTKAAPDPSTAVLVLNLGCRRGPRTPGDHWIYIPKSRSGFHRVGFYSNVDPDFCPRRDPDRVSVYVEKSFRDGERPSRDHISRIVADATAEIRSWGWISEVEVADATWVDVAYTWSWPGSTWREEAIDLLRRHGIVQAGRYGRWVFQGIAESVGEGRRMTRDTLWNA
jgi:protoporphyrinogen oxidase